MMNDDSKSLNKFYITGTRRGLGESLSKKYNTCLLYTSDAADE